MKRISVFLIALFLTPFFAQASPPDLATLKESTYIMGPDQVHRSWAPITRMMAQVEVFDRMVERMASVLCGKDENRSILLISEPGDTYRYLFARMAVYEAQGKCKDLWHAEVNIAKVEAGHRYVGDVEKYWREKILEPAAYKNVVLYLRSLGQLIGIGAHSNDATGIEQEYAANITSGQLRTVAFVDKYAYQYYSRSEHAYVTDAFAEKIFIEPLPKADAMTLLQTYLKTTAPMFKLEQREADYLFRTIEYYQPNVFEPQRSMTVLKSLIRTQNRGVETERFGPQGIESPHPYKDNSKIEHEIHHPTMVSLRLEFEFFDTEKRFDTLQVRDGNSDTLLDTFSGLQNDLITRDYETNRLKLIFESDKSRNRKGYKLARVIGKKYVPHTFSLAEIREAIFEIVQIPRWLLERDYSVVRELKEKLDGDVVGVTEGKRDLIRLVKNGYVAGRTDEKPVASNLFVGPTGTGKSYIAKKLAKFMDMKLITLDMTQYSTPESFDRFLETVANHLVVNPFAIYLFEEIDKANVAVLDRLYFMLDEGVFYDKFQRPLFARGAFVLMTTNTAKDVIIEERNNPNLRRIVNKELQKHFRPSFLNRFDAMSIFYPFNDEEFQTLANIMLNKKIKRMREYFGWKLNVDDLTRKFLGQHGRSELYGARPMERLVENVISTGIAEYQIQFRPLEFDDVIDIKKLTEGNWFQLEVNKKDQLRYEAELRNNDGGFKSLNGFLKQIRMY